MVFERGGLCEISGVDSVARRIRVSWMWRLLGVAHRARTVARRGLRAPEFAHRRNRLCGQPQAVAPLVPCAVADDGAKNRALRQKPVRHPRVWQLPDGLRVVAQAAQRHGVRGARTPPRARGGGQNSGPRGGWKGRPE